MVRLKLSRRPLVGENAQAGWADCRAVDTAERLPQFGHLGGAADNEAIAGLGVIQRAAYRRTDVEHLVQPLPPAGCRHAGLLGRAHAAGDRFGGFAGRLAAQGVHPTDHQTVETGAAQPAEGDQVGRKPVALRLHHTDQPAPASNAGRWR